MVFFAFLGQLHLCQKDSCKRSALVMDTSSVSYMVIIKNPFPLLPAKRLLHPLSLQSWNIKENVKGNLLTVLASSVKFIKIDVMKHFAYLNNNFDIVQTRTTWKCTCFVISLKIRNLAKSRIHHNNKGLESQSHYFNSKQYRRDLFEILDVLE